MSRSGVVVEKTLIVFSSIASLLILFIILPLTIPFTLMDSREAGYYLIGNPLTATEFQKAMRTTLLASAAATGMLLLLGIPLAYILARYDFPLKTLLEAIIDVPLVLPHAVAGVLILSTFGGRSPLRPTLEKLGLTIEDTFLGVVVVMAFVSAPIMVDTLKVGFASIDPSLEYVARSLGASGFRAFTTVTLPLALRSILAASVLSWARAVSEVGALMIVAYYPKTIGIVVWEWATTYGLSPALAASLILALVAIAVSASLRVLVRT